MVSYSIYEDSVKKLNTCIQIKYSIWFSNNIMVNNEY